MKLFASFRLGHNKFIYFCGLCIYERKNSQYGKVKTFVSQQNKKFFGGFFCINKIQQPYKYFVEKKIQFFSKEILTIIKDGTFLRFRILNIFDIKFSLLTIFKKKYFKCLDKSYRNIIILNGNSGEICIFLKYILGKLLNIHDNFFIIVTKKYHIDLIKVIWPNLQFVYIPNFQLDIKERVFTIDGFSFLIVFPTSYFIDFENSLLKHHKEKCNNYYDQLIGYFNFSKKSIYSQSIKLDDIMIEIIINKIQSIKLNLEKFIFICPEAPSCRLINMSFWNKIGKIFIQKGYDIFVNLTDQQLIKDFSERGYKTCNLTYLEAFLLAKKAKKIIALRSGLVDFLVYTKVPCVIFYTSFNVDSRNIFLSADVIKESFSINSIPETDRSKVNELCVW